MDAAGNATLQTPHDSETGEWIFSSHNINTNKTLRVDMERLTKNLDKIFGGNYVFENDESYFQGESSITFKIDDNGNLEIERIKAKQIITEEFEMTDKVTGEKYCTWIENGEWTKVKSPCEDLTKSQIISNDQNSKQTSDQNLEQMPVKELIPVKESVLTSTE
jgi:hypothetical protein